MRKLPSSLVGAVGLCVAVSLSGAAVPESAQAQTYVAEMIPSADTERYVPDIPANRALRDAIGRGDLRAVRAALAAGASPEAQVYDNGKPETACALVLTVRSFPQNSAIFRLLAERTRDVNIATPDYGLTLLMIATESGDLALVKSLVARGAKINARTKALTENFGTPAGGTSVLLLSLMSASLHDTDLHPVAAYLIAQGADVNTADASGMTPLIHAAQLKRPALTRLLLANGADPQKRDQFGRTALRWAVLRGADEVVAALRPVTTLDLWEAAYFDDAARVKELLSGGADPNAKRSESIYDEGRIPKQQPVGETPLAATATGDSTAAMRLLIAAGANVRQIDPKIGRNALHIAAASGSDAVIPLLLGAGADINAAATRGFVSTPLTIAVAAVQPETVALLLKSGAKLGVNRQGEVALANLLRETGREPFLRPRELPAGKVKRGEAFLDAQFTILDALVRAGVDIDAVGAVGIATSQKQTEIVEYLLEKGGSPNAHFSYRDEDKTALMAAISAIKEGQRALPNRQNQPLSGPEERAIQQRKANLRKCFDLLLKAGADVNDASRDTGETPLMTAVEAGQYGIAEELLKRGAQLEGADKQGRTVLLRIAAEGKNTTAVAWLLQRKADINCRDNSGHTALMLTVDDGSNADWHAQRERESDDSDGDPPNPDGHPAMVALLLGNGANKTAVAKDGVTTALILAKKNGFSAVEALLVEDRK